MKYFVVSDVHSFFYEMMNAITNQGFEFDNPEHRLIVCGDLFDRGTQSVELLELKKQMDFSKKIINIPVISDEAKVEFKKQLDKFINDICLTLEKMMVSIDLKGEYNSIYRKIMMNNEVVE